MAEKGSRPQRRPLRFWVPPSWSSRPAATSTRRTTAQSREKSTLPPPCPRPPAEAISARPPASAARRSVTDTQPPSPASSQNHRSQPVNKNIKPPSRSQTETKSATASRAGAQPSSTLTLTGSDKYSQYQSPATKRSPAKPPCTPARNGDKNVQQLAINSLESFPDSSRHASTSKKEAIKINLDKVEPSKLQEDDKLTLTIATQVASAPTDDSSVEGRQDNATQDGSKKMEIKIEISPISQDQFIDGKRAIYKEEIRECLSRLVQKIGSRKNAASAKVITLAGKNNGACMVIGSDSAMHKEEIQSKNNGKTTFSASINNNVQSINNSSIDRSSCSVRNPGVHLEHIRPTETRVCEKSMEPLQPERTARRALVPSQNLTHEPRIRRRCLRALFMESSESDPDNPKKPRRHGCRFSCEEKRKAKIDNSEPPAAITGEQNNRELM